MERIRIVLADDHALVREGTRRILDQQPNMDVVGETGDGVEAVSLIVTLRPDVAILDMRMEGLNGIEVTRRVRELAPETRVLILSGYDDDHLVLAVLEAGAQGYQLKTARAAELVQTVEAVAANETVLHPSIAARLTQILMRRGQSEEETTGREVLTPREREVLQLAAQGLRNREIAEHLGVSSRTIESHFSSILNRLGVATRTAAVMHAAAHNWLTQASPAEPEPDPDSKESRRRSS